MRFNRLNPKHEEIRNVLHFSFFPIQCLIKDWEKGTLTNSFITVWLEIFYTQEKYIAFGNYWEKQNVPFVYGEEP